MVLPELDWVWITIGYTIFLWSSLQLIGVNHENPNMLVAAFFYLSCGLLVTISTGRARWGAFLGLGVMLGLSYLTNLRAPDFFLDSRDGMAGREAESSLRRDFRNRVRRN